MKGETYRDNWYLSVVELPDPKSSGVVCIGQATTTGGKLETKQYRGQQADLRALDAIRHKVDKFETEEARKRGGRCSLCGKRGTDGVIASDGFYCGNCYPVVWFCGSCRRPFPDRVVVGSNLSDDELLPLDELAWCPLCGAVPCRIVGRETVSHKTREFGGVS